MRKEKTYTTREATYGSRDYHLGIDYLTANRRNNSHLKSCYEGVSFRNLARCIASDRGKGALELDEYLERPRRFILTSALGKITGVMVTASMPEFYQEIEYEDYAVIDSENALGYNQLLDHLSFTGKAEIVTFNEKQAQSVKSRFAINKIHSWSVFGFRGKMVPRIPANITLMNDADLDLAERLSKVLPEESSPLRSLQFQLKGFPYKNYVLSFNNGISIFAGICPYSSGVCQLSYLLGSHTDHTSLQSAIDAIGRLAQDSGLELIWRLRKNEALKNRLLITQSSLVELAKEEHLHLTQPSNTEEKNNERKSNAR